MTTNEPHTELERLKLKELFKFQKDAHGYTKKVTGIAAERAKIDVSAPPRKRWAEETAMP